MSTTVRSSEATTQLTGESKIAKAFGLEGDNWIRHANPVSVWTRFAVLPLLAVSIWSRDWIGWWSLVPITLSLIFIKMNPVLFAKPKSTRNWASKAVLGERVWADRNKVDVPSQYRSQATNFVTYAFQIVGIAFSTYGLVVLGLVGLLTVTAGLLLVQCAKAWYCDRMVLLFEDMKVRTAKYAEWEY